MKPREDVDHSISYEISQGTTFVRNFFTLILFYPRYEPYLIFNKLKQSHRHVTFFTIPIHKITKNYKKKFKKNTILLAFIERDRFQNG